MLTLAEAREIAKAHVLAETRGSGLIRDDAVEKAHCWVFSYETRFNGDPSTLLFSILAKPPIVVDRSSGKVHALSSSTDWASQFAAYDRAHNGHEV
jgi:hypothetical protein